MLLLVLIVMLAFFVRALTANFLRAHLDDPGWFPYGIYAAFDAPAQDWLDGRAPIFRIDDPARTDKAIYAPGYPLWLAFIYKLSGSRSPATVQNVQWVLDSFFVFLIVGVGVTTFGWRVGLWAGGIAALWPLLASGNTSDAPIQRRSALVNAGLNVPVQLQVPFVVDQTGKLRIHLVQMDMNGSSYWGDVRVEDLTPEHLLPTMRAAWERLLSSGCVAGPYTVASPDGSRLDITYYALANALPGQHLIAFSPAGWPDEELLGGFEQLGSPASSPLTAREVQVLGLAADGLSAPLIATELGVSVATVRTHFGHIYDKLDVGDRAGAVAKAMRLGLIA